MIIVGKFLYLCILNLLLVNFDYDLFRYKIIYEYVFD